MSDRSPSPPVCTHPKHPITGHCVSCLIRHRKTVCCQEFPCHRHAGEPDTFWDRVAAHEVTLANRRERKKERRAQKTTPQKPGAAPPAPVVSPAKSCAGDWPREVFGAAQGQASGLTLGFQGPSRIRAELRWTRREARRLAVRRRPPSSCLRVSWGLTAACGSAHLSLS